MLNISITQVEYSNRPEGPVIHVFGRTEKGVAKRIDVSGFKPYFYAEAEQVVGISTSKQMVADLVTEYKSIRGEPVRRVYTHSPSDINDVRERFRHFEADIPFATRFMIDCGLTGGLSVPSEKVEYTQVKPAVVEAPARVNIIDIECDDSRGFPTPEKDPVICITCWDSFGEEYVTFLLAADAEKVGKRICRSYQEGGLENGCFVESKHSTLVFQDEMVMLRAFVDYISDRDPDILSGWNFTGFDLPYVLGRMEALEISTGDLARLPGPSFRGGLKGRAIFDLLLGYQKMHLTRKESYRLDAIAMAELGQQKVRYTGTINSMWKENPEKLVEYNFKDVELCVLLNKKDSIIEFYRELARYVGAPLDRTLSSSAIIDIYVLKKAHGRFVLPSKNDNPGEQFEGATVFEPSRGLRENVIVLDLKSLYPMAMITINASIDTKDPNGELVAPNGVRFKKEPDGLVRGIVMELLKERDAKKALRNTYAFGSNEYKVLNMQQDVIKVIMNTYYGVSGNDRFRLSDREIGSAVTSVGRAILEHSKRVIESVGHKVIYGDSVGKDSKISIYNKEGVWVGNIPISDLFTEVVYTKPDGREYCDIGGLFTDTLDKNAFSVVKPIKYVMRHKVNKKMYRVWLNNETSIDVTEDHSLFGYLGSVKSIPNRIVEVKPEEIGRSVKSLIYKKCLPVHKGIDMGFPEELYELLGYFIGCGSFDRSLPQKNYYGHLAGGDDQEELIEKVFKPLQDSGWILSYWKKKKGDIAFNGRVVKVLNEFMRDANTGLKQIPDFIYDEISKNRCAFLRGVLSSDGTCMVRGEIPLVRYTSVKKSFCEEIQSLLFMEGVSSSMYRGNTPNSYKGVVSGTFSYYLNVKSLREFSERIGFIEVRKSSRLDKIFSVKKKIDLEDADFDIVRVLFVEEIDYRDYVYDIEVGDTHRFFANNILVHNTDSCAVQFPAEWDREATINEARRIEKILNESYKDFAKKELNADVHYFSTKFEKIYARFFQAGKKKKYAGLLTWKEGQTVNEVDVVGFELKRSDTPHVTKDAQKTIMTMILNGQGFEPVRVYLNGILRKYRRGEYPLDDIGIPGGIGKALHDYDRPDAQVRGAIYANEHLHTNFGKGSKPKRIYIKAVTSKYPRTDVLCFEYADQVPKEFIVDMELMLEKTVRKPIERVIDALGWSWLDVDPTMTTLSQWGFE